MKASLQATSDRPDSELFRLAEACAQCIPDDNQAALLACLKKLYPTLEFHSVLTRVGWYRLGGVIDREGNRISDDLAQWVESEAGDDVLGFYNKYVDERLRVTRLDGRTHYLVAQTGDRPQDFIQLEIEEVEEVVDRLLLGDEIPDFIEEIIDPVDSETLEPEPISASRYLFRRMIPIADYLDSFAEELDIKPPIVRFMADWANSSAGEAAVFCEHWVLAFREYTDGYGEPRFVAKPITTYRGDITVINDDVPRGTDLANLIHGFDRQVGYPMAWYFFMLSHKQVSHAIAESIHQDLMGAYDYLPVRDMKVLQQWYDRGYGV